MTIKWMMQQIRITPIFTSLAIALAVISLLPLHAQDASPKFEVDPSWPKPLPNLWVTGAVGGVCVDAQDHVFILNRRDLSNNDLDAGHQAPPVIELDPEGNVVNSFGDPDILPSSLHGCTVDRQNNVWIGGNRDGVVEKYSHDGKLLLQIGQKGVVDSSDGTLKGKPLNSSHSAFFKSSAIAVDQNNGDVYVADGEGEGGNHRVAVFDSGAHFLRQWEPHRSEEEIGDAFVPIVHCVAMSNDGEVYTCDRRVQRVQVFDKMGNFKRNIPIKFQQRTEYATGPGHKGPAPGSQGSAVGISFSADQTQRYMYVINSDDEEIEIVDRSSGQVLSSFGRVGHQAGELTFAHFIAADSKNNIYVAEIGAGKRVQKFRMLPR